MCWIDSQSKKLIHLKHLIFEILIPFSLYSVGLLVLHTLNTVSPEFSRISNNKKLSFFWHKGYRKNVMFLCLFLQL